MKEIKILGLSPKTLNLQAVLSRHRNMYGVSMPASSSMLEDSKAQPQLGTTLR